LQLDRRLISSDWPKKLQLIQAKARDAAKDLSPGLINQLRTTEDGTSLDYFDAKDILEKLKETAERGLLGSLTGVAGTWERIVKAYESTLLQVAEGGMALSRNVDYEIPYLKKQAAKNQQLITDLEKRCADAIKSADQSTAEFRDECEKIGIPTACASTTARMRAALVAQAAQQAPGKIKDAVDAVVDDSTIAKAMRYYASFVEDTLGIESKQQLLILAEVREGRTQDCSEGFAAENITGITPNMELEALSIPKGDSSAPPDSIQWDIDMSATVPKEEKSISWDVDLEDANEVDQAGDEATRQDWNADISADVAIEGRGLDCSLNPLDSDLDAAVLTETRPEKEFDLHLSPAVKRILGDPSYRALLLDDLFELQSFLARRHIELVSSQDTLQPPHPRGHEQKGSHISDVDAETVSLYLKGVDRAIEMLTEERMMQLLSILSNPAYVDQLVAKFVRKGGQEGKHRSAAKDAEHRKVAAQRQLMGDSAKLAALIRRTKRIKVELEIALRTKLRRPVNVQGEINVVLNSAG
jgi:hypothetical protein